MPEFSHDEINMDLLRQRAFNLRWATVDKDVIVLTAADPDFPVAIEIQEAIKDYVGGGVLSYGPPEGLPGFRESASNFMRTRRNINCGPEHILAANSVASAMHIVAQFALKPGDEAIIFDPVDFLFQASVEAVGGKAVRSRIDKKTGAFDIDAIEKLITPKTRMIGVCNPHNPLGLVMPEETLRKIGEIAVNHDLWILSDEIWSDIVYESGKYVSLASLGSDIQSRTLTVYGFSKSFGLAGLRIGFVVAPDEKVFNDILDVSLAKTTISGVSTVSQIAAQAAHEKCFYWLEDFLKHLTKVRNYAVERLNGIDRMTCRNPDGTYLLFPDIQAFGLSSEKMAEFILKEARVAVVPGAPQWFGPAAEGHIRLAYPTSMEIVKEALDRIECALLKI